MLEANNIIIGELTPKQQLEGSLDNTIVYVYPETTSIEIIPTETSQTFIPEEGTYYDEVNVEGYVVPTEEITITATGQQQTIYPSNNNYINKINVNPIDVPFRRSISLAFTLLSPSQTVNSTSIFVALLTL